MCRSGARLPPDTGLRKAAEEARAWYCGAALPFWAQHGVDRAHGGFHERLHPDGSPDRSAAKRVRVQSRQTYVFADAARRGWLNEGAALAEYGLAFLNGSCARADGLSVHTLTQHGHVLDGRADAYDQAFHVLALCAMARAGQIPAGVAVAQFELVIRLLGDPALAGAVFEDDRHTEPRRQNPHMHLFETALAGFEAAGASAFAEAAARLFALCAARVFDAQGGVAEFFDKHFMPLRNHAGHIREPGHGFEWVWLLARGARLLPRLEGGEAVARGLYARALQGVDAATGLVRDREDSTQMRLWPQTERLKAECALMTIAPDLFDAGRVTATWVRLRDFYLKPALPGGWIDRCGADGAPVDRMMPQSTMYHLHDAVVTLIACAEGAAE